MSDLKHLDEEYANTPVPDKKDFSSVPDGKYQVSIEKLEMSASVCLFVGDNPDADIKGAKDAGMKTCLAAYGQWKKSEQKADFTIERFSELFDIVERIA